MPVLSKTSLEKLNQCDERLIVIFKTLINYFDFKVICGHRGEKEQNEAFYSGKSKLLFPNSKHNSTPSQAIDVYPYPVNLKEKERFYYMAGRVKQLAADLNIGIRWGGDWDGDNEFKDNTFNDLGHFEV